ncbi:hypothetical protein SODALDRAFT_271152 [Sodiomyces alkalinus F11]|uniref:Zn(2)-C6 fungal-type domain-containing protein n=1 Tax=Sodiomyces alkalinus (strain CBS 110278 / VKM F-3762 / F11) TaxID=1314773 RepID=A0A3N2Q3K5_SODAK|nr:hypothetical protein SODALDRAFT_271152 [Sodiomyces alkalinus F11]ROT41340.1 hypothetical protein SODALDRAFT_271152 [Sodiomyces alkalinus F11]
MSFDAGQQLPPTPVSYRPSFPPPQPISQPSPYEQTPYPHHPSPAEPIYSHVSYAATQKRKATRASQACDNCRQLKAKCDETKPCKTCREKNVECKYRDPIPKAADKAQTDMLEALAEVKSILYNVDKKISDVKRELPFLRGIKLEADAETVYPALSAPVETHVGFERTPQVAATPQHIPQPDPPHGTPQPAYTPVNEVANPMSLNDVEDANLEQTVMEDERDDIEDREPPGPAVRPGKSSIPEDHTTSAGFLLTWPPIRAMTQHLLLREGIQYPEDFPQSIEERRGVIKLFGKGEGHGRWTPQLDQHGVLDVSTENYSDPGSSPAGQADWGQIGSLSPGAQVDYKSSTLTPQGQPDFSEATVLKYIKSFEDHILSMHPILLPKHLKIWVRSFLNQTAPGDRRTLKVSGAGPSAAVAKFANSAQMQPGDAIGKRKRSPTSEPADKPRSSPGLVPGKPYRTVDNALVLAALALGKLSLHKGKVPDVAPSEYRTHSSPAVRNGYPTSPAQSSPPSHSQSSGLPSPRENSAGMPSRRPSWQGTASRTAGQSMRRNYDIIPGLEYLANATDIMGNQNGSLTLRHVQTNIFIGLYYGQLGYPIQSEKYIVDAGYALQVVMRRDLPRFQKYKKEMKSPHPSKIRENLVLLAFWTCLQLESDIVVELSLPRSGILSYEEYMPHPNLTDFNWTFLARESYLALLVLRSHGNLITKTFYSNEPPEGSRKPGEAVSLETAQAFMWSMKWVPETFKFSNTDPPATDMLTARVRAKYWGFQVITLRPFIKMILDFTERQMTEARTGAAGFPGTRPHNPREPYIDARVKLYEDIDPAIIESAKEGIFALVQSTEAFHGLKNERLILTNFFGTAMAQWGNLLVLAACFRDPFLGQFVNEGKLRTLFDRTMYWISLGAQPSSSLAIAIRMLEGLRDELFWNDPRASMSFSSSKSGHGATVHQSPGQPASTTLPHLALNDSIPNPLEQPAPISM